MKCFSRGLIYLWPTVLTVGELQISAVGQIRVQQDINRDCYLTLTLGIHGLMVADQVGRV